MKWYWYVLIVLLVFVLFWLSYIYWWGPGAKEVVEDGKSKTEITVGDNSSQTANSVLNEKNYEIQELNKTITLLKGQLAIKDQQIADLTKTCTGKTVYLKAKSTGGSSGNTNSDKGLKSGNVGGDTGNTEKDAEYIIRTNQVPKSKVTIEVNELKFCIRLGDLYWPHLAVLELKEEFPEIVKNDDNGYDLFILPSGTVGSDPKGYGISEDKIFYIKRSRLTHWPDKTPYFIDKNGGWLEGKIEGDYWIAKQP